MESMNVEHEISLVNIQKKQHKYYFTLKCTHIEVRRIESGFNMSKLSFLLLLLSLFMYLINDTIQSMMTSLFTDAILLLLKNMNHL